MKKMFILWLSIQPFFSYADVTFHVQTAEQISHLIQHDNCAPGYGRIPTGTKIEIKNYYIPSNQQWFWVYTGDGSCQSLSDTGLGYLTYHATGNYSGDKIVTGYGNQRDKVLFNFTFTIPPSNCPDNACPWYCNYFVGSNPPEIIGCAQDI